MEKSKKGGAGKELIKEKQCLHANVGSSEYMSRFWKCKIPNG